MNHYEKFEQAHGVKSHHLMMYIVSYLHLAKLPIAYVFYVGMAIKYILRAGLKDEWRKDAYKAADFLCMALSGSWLSERIDDDNNENPVSDMCFDPCDYLDSAVDCLD